MYRFVFPLNLALELRAVDPVSYQGTRSQQSDVMCLLEGEQANISWAFQGLPSLGLSCHCAVATLGTTWICGSYGQRHEPAGEAATINGISRVIGYPKKN